MVVTKGETVVVRAEKKDSKGEVTKKEGDLCFVTFEDGTKGVFLQGDLEPIS